MLRLVARYFPHATAYANYQNPLNGPLVLKDWQHGYWGENYARLREIKSKYDPSDVFTKPFTVGAKRGKRAPLNKK